MAVAYIHPLTNEPVEKERWRWVAIYADGSTLEQFEVKDGMAIFHPFSDIDTTSLATFALVHDSYKPIVVEVPEGAKLLHAYVTAVIQEFSGDGEYVATNSYKGYKIGYRLNNQDFGILVDNDDSIKLITDFNNVRLAAAKGQ